MSKAIAIIPARGGSKRLPGKNILPFLGRPMISYPIEAARKSGVFDKVIVSTDDDKIAAIAKQSGAESIMRPDELATDEAHELDAARHVLQQLKDREGFEPDAFCLIYATAVFLQPQDFIQSMALLGKPVESDVVMCVSGFNYHPYKTLVKNERGYLEMLFPKECQMRSQFYPHAVASNGTMYWLRTMAFLENDKKSYYVDRLTAYEIPFERAIDIDTAEDFSRAEDVARFKKQG